MQESPLQNPGDSHGQWWCLIRLAKVISPEGLPQGFHQRELEVYHDIHDGLQGQDFTMNGNGARPACDFLPEAETSCMQG